MYIYMYVQKNAWQPPEGKCHVCLKPPSDNPYDMLKAQLIHHMATLEQKEVQQLSSGEELGDRKSTQLLLRRMQQLLGDNLFFADTNSFLRELFLQCLSANVQMVLASIDTSTSLKKLVDMADKFLLVTGSKEDVIPSSLSGRRHPSNKLTLKHLHLYVLKGISHTQSLSLLPYLLMHLHCGRCTATNYWSRFSSPLWITCQFSLDCLST